MSKFALSAALLVLCACGPSRTYNTKNGSVTVTKSGNNEDEVHITGKDGTTLDRNSGTPITDYPADAPLYAGKTVMDAKAKEKNARVISLQIDDPMEKVSDFYKKEIESKGWKTESTMSTPQMAMYVATKDSRQLTVTIAKSDDTKFKSVVNQTIGDK